MSTRQSQGLPASGLFKLFVSITAVLLTVSLAPKGNLALGLWVAAVCSIFLGPPLFRIPSHVWGPLSAVTALLTLHALSDQDRSVLTAHAVIAELRAEAAIPVLILALAYLSISLDDSGFFKWCAIAILRLGCGRGRRLLIGVFVGVSVITLFTNNDVVILAMTPILIHLGRKAQIRNLTPLLITQFFAAHTASMALFTGNPTNIVIAHAAGLGFTSYATRMAIPTIVATIVAFLMVMVFFVLAKTKNQVEEVYIVPDDVVPWTGEMTFKVILFAISVTLLSVFGSPTSAGGGVWTLVAISAAGSLAAFGYDLLLDFSRRASNLKTRVARVPFEIFVTFFSFCLLLRGLLESGWIRLPADQVVKTFGLGRLAGAVLSGFYAIAAVNLMNNIPASILFEKLWSAEALGQRLGGVDADIFADCAIYASNFGANLTFAGALAGLMWFRIIEDARQGVPGRQSRPTPGPESIGSQGVPGRQSCPTPGPESMGSGCGSSMQLPTRRDFVGYGILFVVPVTVITCAVIAFLRG
jgi:arsenical pump membrane protein